MKRSSKLLLPALTLASAPALAHVGPEALNQHFVEHLLIALAVAVPVGYGILYLLRRGGFRR